MEVEIIEITCEECGCLFQVEVEDGNGIVYSECPLCGSNVRTEID